MRATSSIQCGKLNRLTTASMAPSASATTAFDYHYDLMRGRRIVYGRHPVLFGRARVASALSGAITTTSNTSSLAGLYHYDYNGNATNATDATILVKYQYDPSCEVIRMTGPLASLNPFQLFTNSQTDEAGLSYYGHRYYNPSTGRWPNRDPLGDKGSLVFAVEKMQPMEDDKFFTMAQILKISVDEFAKVNANLYGFVANDPNTKVDPLGLDWLDCMAKCIEKSDPLNDKCKVGLGAVGGTFPYRWVRPIFGTKLGTPLTTVPSVGGKIVGGAAEKCMRGAGRVASPVFIGYGLGMAGIECACAAQCASDSKSFDW